MGIRHYETYISGPKTRFERFATYRNPALVITCAYCVCCKRIGLIRGPICTSFLIHTYGNLSGRKNTRVLNGFLHMGIRHYETYILGTKTRSRLRDMPRPRARGIPRHSQPDPAGPRSIRTRAGLFRRTKLTALETISR